MPTYLKISCILSLTTYTIANIGWAVHVFFAITPNWTNPGNQIGEFMGVYGGGFGYYFLCLSFAIRLYYAFKGSMLHLSQTIVKYVAIMGVIVMCSFIVSFICRLIAVTGTINDNNSNDDNNNNDTDNGEYQIFRAVSIYLSGINMILYIGNSILLLKIMFYKLHQFTQLLKFEFGNNQDAYECPILKDWLSKHVSHRYQIYKQCECRHHRSCG